MFEGTNKLSLSQTSMMKMVEDYINKNIFDEYDKIAVTDMNHDSTDWTTTFTFQKVNRFKDVHDE